MKIWSDVTRWAAGGALIAGTLSFVVQFVWGYSSGNSATQTLYQSMPQAALAVYALVSLVCAVLGGGIGAVAEVVAHTPRTKRRAVIR